MGLHVTDGQTERYTCRLQLSGQLLDNLRGDEFEERWMLVP